MTNPIDYTSRDYDALRADMLSQAQIKVPEWTDLSTNDFGVAVLEMFAYVGDIMSYYGDRIANEAYLSTATQRANVLSIAKMLDYIPGGNIAAQVTLTLTSANGGSGTIPAGTQVTTTAGDVTFETLTAGVVPVSSFTTVVAVQGVTTTSEPLGSSTGALNQEYTLFLNPVIDGSVKIYVDSGTGPVLWTYLEHLIDGAATDTIFTLFTDASNVVHVVFGDGVNGIVPALGAAITATYRVGGGSVGNVAAHQLVRFATATPAGIVVDNANPASGGGDSESIDSIRINAPRSLFSLQRAVTLNDYEQLAVRVPGVAKANAVSTVYSSTTVYIAPTGGNGYQADNTTLSTQFTSLQGAVTQYYVGKVPASATVTVGQPTYVPITISVTVQVLANYVQDTVRTAVVSALNNYLAFANTSFQQRLAISDLYNIMATTEGVQYASATTLSRTGSGLADVALAANEIPIGLTQLTGGATTITVSANGGIVIT